MKCVKHRASSIPCPTCQIDEYLDCQKQNDELIKNGLPPKHDLTELERSLRSGGMIP